jgi:N-acetylglucosaminyldiphosphoundecaprenol N-acetyl-beta-D-mannosaminyltransferase
VNTGATAERANVAGLRVDPVTMDDVVATVLRWTDARITHVGVGVNANVCNLAAVDPEFRACISAADLAYADGQSVVWASKLLGNPLPERVATTDLIEPLAEACARRSKKLYLLGGQPGVAQRAAELLAQAHPGLRTQSHHGYVELVDTESLVGEINRSRADILLVGLGDPLQQRWVATHRAELDVPAVLTCGGLFDWTSGGHRRAPAWLIAMGCEWLWRLMIEPRRLARRYLVGNPKFLVRVAGQLARRGAADNAVGAE